MTLIADLATTSVESVPACNVCGRAGAADSRWARLLRLPPPYGVLRCNDCGLRWLSPRPGPDGWAIVYNHEHYFGGGETGYAQFAAQRVEAFRERLSHFQRQGIRSVLDYGAATGEFVEIARALGMAAEGIEFSDAAREVAAARGLRLHRPDDPLPTTFDLIHMNHVFEHMPDPSAHLRWCARQLNPGGRLFIEVPYQFDNDLDRLRRALGRGGRQLETNAFSLHHTFFYTKESLRRLCEGAGFSVSTLTQPFAPEPPALSPARQLMGRMARARGHGDLLRVEARSTG